MASFQDMLKTHRMIWLGGKHNSVGLCMWIKKEETQ